MYAPVNSYIILQIHTWKMLRLCSQRHLFNYTVYPVDKVWNDLRKLRLIENISLWNATLSCYCNIKGSHYIVCNVVSKNIISISWGTGRGRGLKAKPFKQSIKLICGKQIIHTLGFLTAFSRLERPATHCTVTFALLHVTCCDIKVTPTLQFITAFLNRMKMLPINLPTGAIRFAVYTKDWNCSWLAICIWSGSGWTTAAISMMWSV